LYDLLRLRQKYLWWSKRFQDIIDRQDMDAHHLLGYNRAGELAAYARLFRRAKLRTNQRGPRDLILWAFRRRLDAGWCARP
jgi:predicted GNAT family N-acyltransferase